MHWCARIGVGVRAYMCAIVFVCVYYKLCVRVFFALLLLLLTHTDAHQHLDTNTLAHSLMPVLPLCVRKLCTWSEQIEMLIILTETSCCVCVGFIHMK